MINYDGNLVKTDWGLKETVYPKTYGELNRVVIELIKKANDIDILILQRNTTYAVGDIAYHKDLPSWARLECVQAGTTGDTIDFTQISSGGYLIPDGTVVWIIDDVRDASPVGMVRASLYLPDGYIKANGATVLRADYPRLVNLADKYNLWTEDTANYPGLFGVGDGLTTFVVPNWIDRMAQFGTGIGNAISAGLPNIEGMFKTILNINNNYTNSWREAATGAFANSAIDNTVSADISSGSTKDTCGILKLDASAANEIYGASATVQPPAIGVLPVIKY